MTSFPEVLSVSRYSDRRLKFLTWVALVFWTVLVLVSLQINLAREKWISTELALTAARSAFNKDLAIRSWAANHGGVYVEVTPKTQPNPYLKAKERDIFTPSGRHLTLMNPAYMFREVLENYSEAYGIYGRIISLKPLNPTNEPDPWERSALTTFEGKNTTEIWEKTTYKGAPFLRLIKPLVAERPCLTCHEQQGYKLGDIRGGITVSVPLEPYQRIEARQIHEHIQTHILFYLVGLAAIALFARLSRRDLGRIIRAEQALTAYQSHLEEEIERRTFDAQTARKRAEEASAFKASFLANMSHEIRTPLSGVLGVANLLNDTNLDRQQKELVETILYSGDYLLMIVNEVLDLSKIEAGKLSLVIAPLELRALVEETLDLFALKATEKRIELLQVFDPDTPACILGDKKRIQQVLINLIGNALKFTEKGEIVIWVKPAGPKNSGQLEFRVADTGPGIGKEAQASLFEAFTQLQPEKHPGTGLGLNICKHLVALMEGRIWVESQLGVGSQFCFTLKAEPAPVGEELAQLFRLEALKELRILVWSRHQTLGKAVQSLTQPYGAQVITAHSQSEVFDDLELCAARCLLLVDLPVEEVELSRFKVALTQTGRRLPLVGLSFLGETQSLPDGALLLRKPLKSRPLLGALTGAGLGTEAPKEGLPPAPKALPNLAELYPLKILLVEDNQINQTLVLKILEKFGYRADVANDGLKAVELAAQGFYDLIFMDIRLPVLNGIEATKRILAHGIFATAPVVIAMTANLLSGEQEEYYAVGIKDLVPKPVLPANLGATLAFWGRSIKKQRHLQQIDLPGSNPALVNQEVVTSRIGVGGEFFGQLFRGYQKEGSRTLVELEKAVSSGADVEAMRLAHFLRGLSANIGADQMARLCFELEVESNNGDLKKMSAYLLELGRLFEQTCEELQKNETP
ncbi:MAG: hypothetical protein A2600_01075 [Candidatus Lambdaproteobacteria bacterium RIFOXYD1_FULL_56_27]|uniref:Sensory/regulatory protein RpfC n=1 Tax=Candidatus Lambdaproteobacteria bacterium RIFOXYD2_FULL_56_26 TaxID=1817773 RepID=A0A1F6GSG7_9PROT|nr:MAG: hypothetical protein A2557_00190 [Candidatus Lambdaproteobacteria bacterium RIFOXYD2_FULL_56_26]OGH01332.1 MAG: hypothetical protein A2426_13025 [Candidatus Lambdaproteobacteria bacterium RIFOXYC1_FULL_56_13]OGH06872.1 MAG: hypothetical protein A2600_01075 [Candidatus Lambdaproteobacteria bacterium RIFOXYD1_FULL_56_27]